MYRILEKISKKQLYNYYIIKKLSIRQVAIFLKCSGSTVIRNLKKYGIKSRSISKASKGHFRNQGKKHPMWKGGKIITEKGYVLIYSPNHPYKTKSNYVLEHRLVMERHLRRYLKPNEIVHHINGIKNDNRIENLCLTIRQSHEHDTLVKTLQKRIRYLEQKLRR